MSGGKDSQPIAAAEVVKSGEVPPPPLLSKGVEHSVSDHIGAYFRRVRGGEMGALPAVGGLVVLFILFGSTAGGFLSERNLANLLTQAAYLIVLAMALVFVLLLGEIDLSAGVTFGVAMIVFTQLTKPGGMHWAIALVIAIGVGAAIGAFTGFFVAKVGVPSFVVTLGLFLGLQGVMLILLSTIQKAAGQPIPLYPQAIKNIQGNLPIIAGWVMLALVLGALLAVAFWDRARRSKSGAPNPPLAIMWSKWGAIAIIGIAAVAFLSGERGRGDVSIHGVPIVVPIVLALGMAGTFLLDRTRYGRYLYAIGGNAEAARRSGVNVARVKWIAFVICSAVAVIAGLLYVSKVGNAAADTGRDIVLQGVAAAVVGGVSLFGGRGRLVHAVIGALVIATIDNGMGLLRMPAGATLAVSGAVLILAATVDAFARRKSLPS